MRQACTIITVILLTCAMKSCIFEDRSDCPACLFLDFSGTPEEVSCINLFLMQENGTVRTDTVFREEFGNSYKISVRKGTVGIAAFGNVEEMIFSDGYITAPGNDADNLYTCFMQAPYGGDFNYDTVRVTKNNIGLHIRVKGKTSDRLSVLVESSSVGYGLDGGIIEGEFRHFPDTVSLPSGKDSHYGFFARVTRQKNADLMLHLLSGGNVLTSVSLSECLTEAGIDMNAPVLEDLYLNLDISALTLTVSTVGWTDTGAVEITI